MERRERVRPPFRALKQLIEPETAWRWVPEVHRDSGVCFPQRRVYR